MADGLIGLPCRFTLTNSYRFHSRANAGGKLALIGRRMDSAGDRAHSLREELAEAMDAAIDLGPAAAELAGIERQDATFVRELGGSASSTEGDPIERLYAARDALTDAFEAAGPGTDGVRRMLRLAIADDLHAAARLRAGATS
jgi:hypothetical protein